MKTAALIIGILGALMTTGLGAKWVSDYRKNLELVESLKKLSAGSSVVNDSIDEITKTKNAGYLMIVFGIAAIGAAAMTFKSARIAGAVMIAAAVLPAMFAPKSLVFSFFLIVAGLLALLSRPKPAAV